MELDELAQRLGMLEESAATEAAAKEKAGFMDKYGTKFSGDEGIGVAILAELGRRGVDTSAADEAVMEILDQIRMEATQILDKIKMDEKAVSDLMDKVQTIEEGVHAATGATPDAGAPPDAGIPPLPDAAGAPPPMDMDMGAPPPGGDVPPPMDMGAPPPGGDVPPPMDVPSDEQLKNIRGRISTLRKASAPPKPTWKPSRSLIGAVGGKT